MDKREKTYRDLVRTLVRMGYPKEFGIVIADNLRTEKTMSRMIGYLNQANPRSANEIADEMLAIMEDRERWIQKKTAEDDDGKDNELRWYDLGED